jgi:hypothetical protein
MPLFSPDFCEKRCPVCTRSRKGHRLAQTLEKVEMVLTFGGCPWGRARQRKYGVRPDEPLPQKGEDQTPTAADPLNPHRQLERSRMLIREPTKVLTKSIADTTEGSQAGRDRLRRPSEQCQTVKLYNNKRFVFLMLAAFALSVIWLVVMCCVPTGHPFLWVGFLGCVVLIAVVALMHKLNPPSLGERIVRLMPVLEDIEREHHCTCERADDLWIYSHHSKCRYRIEVENHLVVIAKELGIVRETPAYTTRHVWTLYSLSRHGK